jgi:hypothetical protein
MAMPMRRVEYEEQVTDEHGDLRSSEVRRAWQTPSPQPSAVQFALHDAQNMLALLAANVEFLTKPDSGAVETVAGDIRESTRRLGQLLSVVAALLKQS